MVKEMYSNVNFLKDDQTDTPSTKMEVMIQWPEGKFNRSLGENNYFKANIHRPSETDSWKTTWEGIV